MKCKCGKEMTITQVIERDKKFIVQCECGMVQLITINKEES